MSQEYTKLVNWLTQPFNTQMAMWKLLLTFAIFVIVGFVVVDNLDLIKKGLRA